MTSSDMIMSQYEGTIFCVNDLPSVSKVFDALSENNITNVEDSDGALCLKLIENYCMNTRKEWITKKISKPVMNSSIDSFSSGVLLMLKMFHRPHDFENLDIRVKDMISDYQKQIVKEDQ